MFEKTTRLRFSDDGLADADVRRAAEKAEKAADRADRAKEKLKKKQAAKRPSDKLKHGRADISDTGSTDKSMPADNAGPRGQADTGNKADPNNGSTPKTFTDNKAAANNKADNAYDGNTSKTENLPMTKTLTATDNKAATNNKSDINNKKTAEKARKIRSNKLKSEPSSTDSVRSRLRFDGSAAGIVSPRITGRTALNAAGTGLSARIHHEMSDNEDDNAGIQAANQGLESAEGIAHGADGLRYARKLRQYGKAVKLDKKADRANVEALYRQHMAENPESGSNSISRWRQKQEIKNQYAAAKRTAALRSGTDAGGGIRDAAAKAGSAVGKAWKHVAEHPKTFIIMLIIAALIVFLCGVCSSVSTMLSGIANGVLGTSFTAEDADILGAEDDFTALEIGLQDEIDSIESDNPGYDEYRYFLDEIGHDPYELAAYLTVNFEDYTREEVQGTLQAIFNQQYDLSLDEEVEIRTRTETRTGTDTYTDPETGESHDEEYEYEVEVEYEYHILNVRLANKGTDAVIRSLGLDDDMTERYGVLLETKGNRDYLFADSIYANSTDPDGGYLDYDIPGEALTDAKFANMIHEAEKYLGYPYVWGGSSPSTSFDCSGFVSWVINHCGNGWNIGRQTANGLKNICSVIPKSELEPGDLVFFQGTYSTSGASHVGIYVGGGMMIHCGNPISYASIETQYWRQHWYCGGRLP